MPKRDVLRYDKDGAQQATVRRQYKKWRAEQGMTDRCDNTSCIYFSEPLVWNGKKLPLILDHINGVRCDSRPESLQFLCPACDSQRTLTRGGANKGRVENHSGGFSILNKENGGRHYVMPVEPGHIVLAGQDVNLSIRRQKG